MKFRRVLSLLLTVSILITGLNVFAAETDKTWVSNYTWISGDVNIDIVGTKINVTNTMTSNDYLYLENMFSNAKLLIAGYKDNEYIGCEALEYSFQPEFSYDYTNVTKFNLDEATRLKAFFWDVSKEVKPFCDNVSKTLSETINDSHYCIITRFWYSYDIDAYKVQIVNQHGQEFIYEVRNYNEATEIAAQLGISNLSTNSVYNYNDFIYNVSRSVALYNLTSAGKFNLVEGSVSANSDSADLEYKATTSKLGGYRLDNETTIIDISGYLCDKDVKISSITLDDFEDSLTYDAFIYDRNSNGTYNFVVITNGTNSLRATSPFAVVKDYAGMTQVDETDVHEWVVIRDGEETTLYTTAMTLAEGDVIMYANPLKGYVESSAIYKVATASAYYNAHIDTAIAGTSIIDEFATAVMVAAPGTTTSVKTFDLDRDTVIDNNDVKLYMGLVYSADETNLSIFTDVENKIAAVADTTDLSISGANITTYDYSVIANEGYRVTNSAIAVIEALFNPLYDADKNHVDFAKYSYEDVTPTLAFVREVDGDVTDVIYYAFNPDHYSSDDSEEDTLPDAGPERIELLAKDIVSIDQNKIQVRKTETSLATKGYNLSSPKVYVNGYELQDANIYDGYNNLVFSKSAVEQALIFVGQNNMSGKVTLVDTVANGSGIYEEIRIDYTDSKIVEYTRTTSSGINEILFKDATKMTWYEDDGNVTFKKNGEEIKFQDLKEKDVLTIAMKPENAYVAGGDLQYIDFADVIVTNHTVGGIVTRISNSSVVLDGIEYLITPYTFEDPSYAIANKFIMYLDAHGVGVYAEQIGSGTNYGIVTNLRWSDDNEAYMVTIIKDNGETATYEVKDSMVMVLATAIGASTNSSGKYEYTYYDFLANVEGSVITYKLQNEKFVLDDTVNLAINTNDLEFRESVSKLGGYLLDKNTKIIDLSGHLVDRDIPASQLSLDSLKDGNIYDACIFDKNNSGAWNFVIITSVTDVTPDVPVDTESVDPIAVVRIFYGRTSIDEVDVYEYGILCNGEELSIYVEIDGTPRLNEGDIIMCPMLTDSSIKSTEIIKLYSPETDYNTMINKALSANTAIIDVFKNDYLTSDTIDINGTETGGTRDDVKSYMGLVYSADMSNLSIFTDLNDGVGAVVNTKDYFIDGANMTTYNYNVVANKGYRVEASASAVIKALFNPLYTTNDKNYVDFSRYATEQVEPTLAFVREIDNDVTDVIYYTFN